MNYPDTGTNYDWAVLPAPDLHGIGVASTRRPASSYPQSFDLHSMCSDADRPGEQLDHHDPADVPMVAGDRVRIQYRLYVSTDPSFGN